VLDLGEAFAQDDSDLDLLAIERQVELAPTGLQMTFDELQRLAAGLVQVVDGLFVGCAAADRFPSRSASDDEIIEHAHITVAAFDSTFWLVSAPEAVLDRIHAQFERVSERDAFAVNLSAWGR
jgi:hypothetical protein